MTPELTRKYENALGAIEFALDAGNGIEFLRLWNVGDWKQIDQDWPEWREFAEEYSA